MKRSTLTALVWLILFGTVTGQNDIEFTEFDLENGLHVILHEDHSTPIAAINVMYHVGAKNEDTNLTGMAHFFEHLMFEGSENIDRGEYSEYVENAGGVLNASTTNDRTSYFEVLPSNQLELGLWLESERMMHAKINMKGIETQREVVKEEKRQRYDNQPYGKILPSIMERAYTEHPYRWTTIGSMKHLNAAEKSDFLNFYDTYYVPNNAVLSIAGDIDIDSTKKLVEKYFGPIESSEDPVPRVDKEEPKQTQERRDTVREDVQLPALVMAYHTPAQGTEESYPVDMLGRVLTRGKSSRIYKKVVDEKELAIQAQAFAFPLEDPGVTLFFAIAQKGVPLEELEKVVNEEIRKVQEEGITERELEKAKNQIESEFVSQNSTVQGIAQNLSKYHMLYGDAELINTEIERYMDVTREDIKKAANKYFRESNRTVLYYLPKAK